MTSRDVILAVEHLSYAYQNHSSKRKVAVNDISFSIRQGEVFGLVGESGCGKTTTGKLIVQLLKPNSGEISFAGQSLAAIKPRELSKFHQNVQMIFQDPYASLDPRMKVKDIVAEGIKIHKLYKNEADLEQQVGQLLKTVGLQANHASRYPHEFSGGQRQRIGIARALAVQPQLIVCDEPISALDVSIQAQIINLLKELQVNQKLTYLFISHDLGMVHYISDRIGVMLDGKLVEYGLADDVFAHPLHPYTKSLLQAIPTIDRSSNNTKRVSYVPTKREGEFAYYEEAPEHFVYRTAASLYW